jgi:hypothetical protein
MASKMCQVSGCKEESVKTVPSSLAAKVFSLSTDSTKVHLCRTHYKEYKKATKEERRIERADWR